MDKKQAIELAKQYKSLVSSALPITAMYLYGSYSKGCQTDNSDIDIAVIVDSLSDDYFADTPLLWKLRRKISLLIEPVLLDSNDNSPLYQDIIRSGIAI